MKHFLYLLSIVSICLLCYTTAEANTRIGTLTYDNGSSDKISVTFGEYNGDVCNVSIMNLFNSDSGVSDGNTYKFGNIALKGTYNKNTRKFTFPNASSQFGQIQIGSSVGSLFLVRRNSSQYAKQLTATLADDGNTITFDLPESQYLGCIYRNANGDAYFGKYTWENVKIVLNDESEDDDLVECDIIMDNKYTDDNNANILYQKTFDASEYPESAITYSGGTAFVLNPQISKSRIFYGFNDNDKKAIEPYKNNLTSWGEEEPWYGAGVEASIITTDDFTKKMSSFSTEHTIQIIRNDPYNYFTENEDIYDNWIKNGLVSGTHQVPYNTINFTSGKYEIKTTTGVHFKDVFPHRVANGDKFTIDYVVYYYTPIPNNINFGNSGLTTYQYLEKNINNINSSFIKIGTTWYYFAIPDKAHRFIATSASDLSYKPGKSTDATNGRFTAPVGYHFSATFNNDIVTNVKDVVNASAAEVKSVRYTNLQGQASNTPFKGVNIVERTYSDGSRKVTKEIK